MIIIGIGGYSHDASAALIRDGRIVAAAEEERFTRKKHQEGWPEQAIAFCLKQAGITERDIDHIAFYWRPWSFDGLRSVMRRIAYLPIHPVFSAGFLLHQLHDTAWYVFHLRRLRAKGGGRAKIHFVRHHDTHAASAYYCSGFEDAAVLTIDSRGEWATSLMYHGRGGDLRELKRINLPHSIGVLYLCVTNFLGFKTGDEYKVMGLAAFGEPKYTDRFRRIVDLRPAGTYRLDSSYFKVQHSPGRFEGYVSGKFKSLFGEGRRPEDEITREHKDIAASLQAVLEETVFHVLRGLHDVTKTDKLCLAGGVAQNSVMCGKIVKETPFTEVFIQPASGDNGCSLGAAEWVWGRGESRKLKAEMGEEGNFRQDQSDAADQQDGGGRNRESRESAQIRRGGEEKTTNYTDRNGLSEEEKTVGNYTDGGSVVTRVPTRECRRRTPVRRRSGQKGPSPIGGSAPTTGSFTNAYLGPEYSESEIRSALDTAKLAYERPENLVAETAKLIVDGKIVGWFQGRMEWGARALGNRSILADVTDPDMTDKVNMYVKHREDFRPFAPACAEERAEEYFESGAPSPYMLKVFPATEKAKKSMPAIVHVDGSARLQTVSREQNPLFHELLEEMDRIRGVPCVLNTSFNVKGEPIVCSPEDAIRCWSATGLDALVMGPYVVEKLKAEMGRETANHANQR
ncbi:MAG: carbamoyltransferase C-terminal domain-containing protein [Kiritimatiellia bacterium]